MKNVAIADHITKYRFHNKHLLHGRIDKKHTNSVDNYMFKVNNRNTRTRCEICSKLTIKAPERRLASF